MTAKAASPDFRHSTPDDLREVLAADAALDELWQILTPLARNEWICWMTSGKLAGTRTKRLARLEEDILAGKKRPLLLAWLPSQAGIRPEVG